MKFRFIPGVLPVAVVSLLVSCGKPEPASKSTPESSAPRSVSVVRAEWHPMESVVHAVGTLSAHEEATVAAQVAGQIEKSPVDLGDRVTAGQELVSIDTTAYDALVRQAAAAMARANAAAANAARNLKRVQDLQKDEIASSSELDTAVAEADKAQADIKSAEAAEAIARMNLERSRVRAPFEGAVAQRLASAGDYVAVGDPIVRLVKTDPLRLRLDVPERVAAIVRVGQPVRVWVEGDTNAYSGHLARVSPAIRETDRMLPVEADVPNPGALRVGLFARAEIIVNERDRALAVPAGALVVFAGLEKVVMIKDGKVAEKSVTTGRRGVNWVEIVSGLNAGETVVLEPTGLRTGQPVVIKGDASPVSSAGGTNLEGAP